MKLSATTRQVLQNYSEIDPRFVYRQGKDIWTQNMERSILAQAVLDEEIPNDGFIYDISRFLGILSTFGKECEVEFGDTQILLSEGEKKTNFTLADPNIEPERVMEKLATDEWDDGETTFRLGEKDLAHIMKSARIFGLGHVSFHSDGSDIYLSAVDALGNTTDNASVKIADGNGSSFKHFLGIETIKVVDNDYDVTLYERGVAVLNSANENGAKMTYWVACEEVD